MEATSIETYQGQIVELTFADGARIKAHIIAVDPDQVDNHIIYDVLEVRSPGPAPNMWRETPLGTSAERIVEVRATDGQRYLTAPGSRLLPTPWWRFW